VRSPVRALCSGRFVFLVAKKEGGAVEDEAPVGNALEEALKHADPQTIQWSTCCHDCGQGATGLSRRADAWRWRDRHLQEGKEGHLVSIGVEFQTERGTRMGLLE
jgi:hypothetical protein